MTVKKKYAAGSAVALLLAGGLVLGAATPAAAATIRIDDITDIRPDESSYLGWHEGYSNATRAFALDWDGLILGNGADSQIINGLVDTGEPGLPTTAAELGGLITGNAVDVVDGEVFRQVAVTTDDGWGTLRPATGATSDALPALTDDWVSSQTIGTVPANTPTPLGDLLNTLEGQGDLRYSAYGVLGQDDGLDIVHSITWGDDTTIFSTAGFIPSTATVEVVESDIRPDESTYVGWHEGYVNATPAYSVETDGLHLGDGANSQIINGLATPLIDPDLHTLLNSMAVEVAGGEVFLQVPVFFGDGDSFTTLRNVDPITSDTTVSLFDTWTTSNPIPSSGVAAAIAANQPVILGDLLTALDAQGDVEVLAFGVLAQPGAPGIVETITWNGTTYSFVADEVPADDDELAETGIEPTLALGALGMLLLGGALVLVRRVRTQA